MSLYLAILMLVIGVVIGLALGLVMWAPIMLAPSIIVGARRLANRLRGRLWLTN